MSDPARAYQKRKLPQVLQKPRPFAGDALYDRSAAAGAEAGGLRTSDDDDDDDGKDEGWPPSVIWMWVRGMLWKRARREPVFLRHCSHWQVFTCEESYTGQSFVVVVNENGGLHSRQSRDLWEK